MDTKISQQSLINNLKKCPHYNSCSQNLCPLDFELNLRSGGKGDRCRFTREPKKAKVAGREFVSGGAVMPDVPLNFVPQGNVECLNEASRQRLIELGTINRVIKK